MLGAMYVAGCDGRNPGLRDPRKGFVPVEELIAVHERPERVGLACDSRRRAQRRDVTRRVRMRGDERRSEIVRVLERRDDAAVDRHMGTSSPRVLPSS